MSAFRVSVSIEIHWCSRYRCKPHICAKRLSHRRSLTATISTDFSTSWKSSSLRGSVCNTFPRIDDYTDVPQPAEIVRRPCCGCDPRRCTRRITSVLSAQDYSLVLLYQSWSPALYKVRSIWNPPDTTLTHALGFHADVRAQIPGWDALLYVYGTFLIPTFFSFLIGLNMLVWARSRINFVSDTSPSLTEC